MKTKSPFLAVMTFALLAAPLASAGDDAPVKAATLDVSGDGKPEDISVTWDEPKSQFILKVGNATARGSSGHEEPNGFTVVDLDSSDKRKEVVVHTGLTDNTKEAHVYAYDGKSLKAMGTVPSISEARGNGIVLSDAWMAFWQRRDKYVLDAKAGKLTLVPQELYAVGVEATVTESFPLARARTEKTPVANLAKGSKIQVIAAAPIPGKSYLYLVKSSTGLLGWATMDDLAEKTEGLPFAG
ncbi:hypothetical protein [Pyxidicoccus sp. MSG2]|uniref:hypothetical protein n=1 Tax=Pyxidicoccus sp. MSG2 TaxID=2996790 RepID=UPI00226E2842|nr:hypothetical protein [Pyxidicoccus sp. MSG2]MCY1017709.1 hypothetical protein [Pyxidicoccus sp. MSG2]